MDALSTGRNVMILSPPVGILFDIIMILASRIHELVTTSQRLLDTSTTAATNPTSNAFPHTIHLVSSVARSVLALTHISGEFAHADLQENWFHTGR